MRPGQLTLNEFELAILECIAQKWESLRPLIAKLRVLSREYTGVGSYVKFQCEESASELGDQRLGLDALISVPNVPNGMGAVLFCKEGKPEVLETYTYGNDRWDGVFEGFSISGMG